MSNRSNDPDDFDNFDNDLDNLDNDLDNFDTGFGDDDDDLPPLDDDFDEGPESRGPSRTFIIIAAVMILLFVVALGALIFFVTNQGPSPAAQTATVQSAMIFTQNAQTLADATQTAEAALIFGGTLTQEASNQELTANAPTPTETATLPPTVTPTPTLDPTDMAGTQIALNAAATLTAAAQVPVAQGTPPIGLVIQAATAVSGVFQTDIPGQVGLAAISIPLTSTAIAANLQTRVPDSAGAPIAIVAQAVTPVAGIFQTEIAQQGGVPAIAIQQTSTAIAGIFQTEIARQLGVSDIGAVAQTATALAGILLPTLEQGGGVIASPTVEGGFAPLPTALPDTGLFDDLAAGGSNSVGIIALAIVALGAMIFVSRRLRSSINK